MIAIVTGGTGFLGRRVVARLLNEGVQVFVPRHNEYDLRYEPDVARMYDDCPGAAVMIHCAANVGGIGYNAQCPAQLFTDNLLMGVHVLDGAWVAGVPKFVGVGTVCSYPKFASVPFSEAELWNGYPEETNAPYGLAKKMLLVQSQAYHAQYGYNAIHVIPTNLYGVGDNFGDGAHVIPDMIEKLTDARNSNAPVVTLYGDGTPTREFLYVDDAADGVIAAALYYNSPEPVNLGGGPEVSIAELAHRIAALVGYDGLIVWDTSRPNGQPRRKVNAGRAWETMGWYARTSFEDGLRETVEWYLEREGMRV